MAKINNLDDFNKITSNITSFSHAYLFDTNSISAAYSYILEFAKKIICNNQENNEEYIDICYQIDNNEFDDLYIVNPSTISINTEEIEKLLLYMKTKSLRENGRRVYIIYGFERLSMDTSNKILKFLEEPEEGIYAILITENIDKILSTIISRCQTISLVFDIKENKEDKKVKMLNFLTDVINKKNATIAYVNDYFYDIMNDRLLFYEYFEIIEEILSDVINTKVGKIPYDDKLKIFDNYQLNTIINILDITNRLTNLIKQNINLNLLLDRYIIELVKEL